jgi:hypothetical protein
MTTPTNVFDAVRKYRLAFPAPADVLFWLDPQQTRKAPHDRATAEAASRALRERGELAGDWWLARYSLEVVGVEQFELLGDDRGHWQAHEAFGLLEDAHKAGNKHVEAVAVARILQCGRAGMLRLDGSDLEQTRTN